jgi:hypothetical protein
VNEMTDDRDGAFITMYHKALEAVCADMFASKALLPGMDGPGVAEVLAKIADKHNFSTESQDYQRSALVSALLQQGAINESEIGIVEVTVAEHDLAAVVKALDTLTGEVEDSGGEPDDPRLLAAQERVGVAEVKLEVAKHAAAGRRAGEEALIALREKQTFDSQNDTDTEGDEANAAMASMKGMMASKLVEHIAVRGDEEGALTQDGLRKAAKKGAK